MLLEAHLKKRGLRARAEVVVHAAEPIPMAVTGPVIGEQVKLLLRSKGIGYFPNHQVSRVESSLLHFSDGGTAPFELLLYVPPHRAPAVVKSAGLCADSGWVAVDRGTLQTSFAQLYAIGDVTSIPLKMGRPLPKAGVFAHGQAEVVAHNIAHTYSLARACVSWKLAMPAPAWGRATSTPNPRPKWRCAAPACSGTWAKFCMNADGVAQAPHVAHAQPGPGADYLLSMKKGALWWFSQRESTEQTTLRLVITPDFL